MTDGQVLARSHGIEGPEPTSPTRVRRDIQALRGLAVGYVVLFHADLGIGAAGYLGVDIFFVISGFLITSLVVRDVDTGCFSFASFYFRRAKRLLPACYAVLIGTLIASPFFLR